MRAAHTGARAAAGSGRGLSRWAAERRPPRRHGGCALAYSLCTAPCRQLLRRAAVPRRLPPQAGAVGTDHQGGGHRWRGRQARVSSRIAPRSAALLCPQRCSPRRTPRSRSPQRALSPSTSTSECPHRSSVPTRMPASGLPGRLEQRPVFGAVICGTRAHVCSRADDRPATPRRALPHGIHLHRQGVLVMGRHTSRQGDAHGCHKTPRKVVENDR